MLGVMDGFQYVWRLALHGRYGSSGHRIARSQDTSGCRSFFLFIVMLVLMMMMISENYRAPSSLLLSLFEHAEMSSNSSAH